MHGNNTNTKKCISITPVLVDSLSLWIDKVTFVLLFFFFLVMKKVIRLNYQLGSKETKPETVFLEKFSYQVGSRL